MKLTSTLTFLLLVASGLMHAQAGWQYLYQSEAAVESFTAPASNGDIILVADSYSDTAAFFHRITIQRIDMQGVVKQENGLFKPPSFRLGAIQPVSNGELLVMGTTNIPLTDEDSVFITKLDDQDQVLWSKGLQVAPNIHVARGAIETNDGNYLVYGTYEHVNFAEGIFLIKISPDGNLIWSRTINSQLNGAFMKLGGLTELSGGGFWLFGSTRFNTEGSWLARLDSLGQTQSVKFLDTHSLTPSQAEPFAIFRRSNGELDLFYNSLAFQSGEILLAIHTNASGTPQKSTRFYRDNYEGEITAIEPSGDGGYLGAGYSFAGGGNRSDGIAIKIRGDYSVEWSRRYGGPYIEILTSIFPSADGGTVLAGFADFDSVIISPSENGLFSWLVKGNNRGQTSCYDEAFVVTSRDTSVSDMTYQLDNVTGVGIDDLDFSNIPVFSNPDTVTCTFTSIAKANIPDITVYPNPSKGLIFFDAGGEIVQSIRLNDLLGKKIDANVTRNGNRHKIETDFRGMVLVRIQTKNGIVSKKMLIQ